uniref:AIG1-type G domain-containing protein n=2 Tax=Sinocyclocheilus grahami TaxID=75366 RepID=A0A672Q2H7_SINGR
MSKNANESTRMVLLGETGAGKSAAGNTILGQKVFKSAVTNTCLKKHATVAGRIVSVVDTLDFFDTKKNPEQLVRETARSIHLSRPRPHAFLIAFPANMRFTEREEQIPQMVQILFGEDVLKYSILFTHGDQLEGGSIEKRIEGNCALRHLVRVQCGDRYHVLNNKNIKDRKQVNHLLLMIDRMIVQNGGYYTNEMLQDSQQGEEQLTQRRERKISIQRNSGYSFLSGDCHHFNMLVVVVSVAIGVGLGAVCGAPGGALAAVLVEVVQVV